jgi:hypothetical protein
MPTVTRLSGDHVACPPSSIPRGSARRVRRRRRTPRRDSDREASALRREGGWVEAFASLMTTCHCSPRPLSGIKTRVSTHSWLDTNAASGHCSPPSWLRRIRSSVAVS